MSCHGEIRSLRAAGQELRTRSSRSRQRARAPVVVVVDAVARADVGLVVGARVHRLQLLEVEVASLNEAAAVVHHALLIDLDAGGGQVGERSEQRSGSGDGGAAAQHPGHWLARLSSSFLLATWVPLSGEKRRNVATYELLDGDGGQ